MNLLEVISHRSLALGQSMVAAFTENAMNSLVIITRPGVASYNETTREYSQPVTVTFYDSKDAQDTFTGLGAKAGITTANGPITYSVGDEPTYYESITVYVPMSLTKHPHIDDVVKVIFNPDDDLIGREFRVTDVPAGGRINSSIPLACVGIAPSKQWTNS